MQIRFKQYKYRNDQKFSELDYCKRNTPFVQIYPVMKPMWPNPAWDDLKNNRGALLQE